MIRIFYEGQEILSLPDKGWLKRNLKVDIVDHKGGNRNLNEVDIALPVVPGYDIVLRFGKRPETDLGLIEELAREKIMDQEALRSIERQRLLEMDITDPHHPDYIAPDNYTQVTKDILKSAVEEESAQPLVDAETSGEAPHEPTALEDGEDTVSEGDDEGPEIKDDPENSAFQNEGAENPVISDQTGESVATDKAVPSDGDTQSAPDTRNETVDATEGGSDTVAEEGKAAPAENPDFRLS